MMQGVPIEGFSSSGPRYPYGPVCGGLIYGGLPNVIRPEEEESETSLPSSPLTDSCQDELEKQMERYEHERICEDPEKLDWDDILATDFLGEVGLGCYNLQNGTNFQFSADQHHFKYQTDDCCYETVDYSVIMRNSTSEFETRVDVREEEEGCCLRLITTLHAPRTPEVEVEGGKPALDDFFKGRLPSFSPYDTLQPKYYMLSKSELEEYKELFLLYAEITLFSYWKSIRLVEWAKPFVVDYVLVQTLEPRMMAKSENANFYITFSTRHRHPFRAVTRRTTTGKPNQMSLEFKMSVY